MTNDVAVSLKRMPLNDPLFWLDMRRQMLGFATQRLVDKHLAEDVVQDALVGALKNVRSFEGRSTLKTWLFAILQNKMADALRQRLSAANRRSCAYEEPQENFETGFDGVGFWQAEARPVHWADPETVIHDHHFWRVFEACLSELPKKQSRIFMMREFLGFDSAEICKAEGISVSNLHVLLYRARLQLRKNLQQRWFHDGMILMRCQ